MASDSKPSSRSKPRVVLFEDLWSVVGGFGRYPVLLFVFMCYVTIAVDLQQFIQIYYGSAPNYQCQPWGNTTNSTRCTTKDQCGCTNCTFVFGDEFTSAVSEWLLICDRSHLKALSQSVFYGGLLVGSVGFGKLSDKFGRKPSLFLSLLLMAIFGMGSSFANSFTLFAVMRFGAGFATAGALLIRFVYSMEVSTLHLRTFLGTLSNLFIMIGAVLLTLLAYLIRDWRYLMLTASIPCILPLLFWKWIPESPSWLIAKGKLEQAQKVFESFASASNYNVDSKQLASVIREVKETEQHQATDDTSKSGILDFFRTRKMRKRTLILCYNWFVNSVVFYGITLNAKNLGGSFHLNVFILFAVGIPGVLVLFVVLKQCGRRIGYSSLMIFCGLTSLFVLAVPHSDGESVAIKVLAVLGVFSIVATFSSVYIYTSELNPTLLRNLGLGVGSMTSRVGGIIAPYIVYLNDFMTNLPFIVFGVMALTAGFLALFLPETLFSPMPQTVDQVEAWPEDFQLPCRKRIRKPEEVPIREDSAHHNDTRTTSL